MIKIKPSGSFYRLLTVYGDMYDSNNTTSLCNMMWCALRGLVIISFIVAIGAFVVSLIIEPLCVLAMYLNTSVFYPSFLFPDDGAMLFLCLVAWIILIVILIICWLRHIEEKKEQLKFQQFIKNAKDGIVDHDFYNSVVGIDAVKQPNVFVEIIKGLYARIKDKTCVIVKFEE